MIGRTNAVGGQTEKVLLTVFSEVYPQGEFDQMHIVYRDENGAISDMSGIDVGTTEIMVAADSVITLLIDIDFALGFPSIDRTGLEAICSYSDFDTSVGHWTALYAFKVTGNTCKISLLYMQ